jgi:hypothetical protein
MFTVIKPKHHHTHTSLIHLFLAPIKKNSELNTAFSNVSKSTFILMQDNDKGIYGGAILLKNKISSLHRLLSKHVLSSATGDVWTCSAYLHLDNEKLFQDFEDFCIFFYRELYKKLKEFGEKEGVNYIYVKLNPGEYFCTEVLGSWSYVFEIKPHESRDGLFHGVLSLKDNFLYKL